jgi:hypothetical protein
MSEPGHQMPIKARHFAALAIAILAGSLSGCGNINEKLAEGIGDYVPRWAGGLPADAPPRPGTAKYEEFVKERERRRLEPAVAKDAAKDNAAKSAASSASPVSLDPVH